MGSSNHTVVTADSKFFIMSTVETFHEISPFLVHKLIQSHIGEVKNVKKLKSGDLLIEVSNSSQATTLSKPTTLGNLKVNVSVHRSLNFSRGVISERGLKNHTEVELVQELSEQKVCAARCIYIKRDGQLIPTQHVVLTFSTTDLPKFIKAGYLRCTVKPYIPNPVRCFKCQKFGHSQQACRGSKICAKCSVSGHDSSECISDDVKCINCHGDHPAYSRSCPQWILEKEILSTKIRRNISFAEARKLVTDRNPKPGLLYSSAVKQCSHCVHITDSTKAESNMSSKTILSTIPPNSSQRAKEPPISANTSSTINTLLKQKSESSNQIQTIKVTNNQNSSNSKKPEHLKEKKEVKKARLAASKKKKDLTNRPITKNDFF
ncbi:uncharacterized protein LOC129974670 [Argiope bruennichi]|uniref:uncharacterized protein LOC129974670 n=1 Tax=Argiope bruennichi TaxID=94029 RepID=UPI00249559C5|nr:uncharacterized protein LOC129974670 [Argiope bruennichi]